MEDLRPISAIIDSIAFEMERLHYSPATIKVFQSKAQHLRRYVLETMDAEFFTEEIGAKYLKEVIGFPFETYRALTGMEREHVKCVRRIGEYQLYGATFRNKGKRITPIEEWSLGNYTIIAAYVKSVQTADNSEATKKLRIRQVKSFYDFMALKKINGIQEVTGQLISDYVTALQGGSPIYTKHLLATLRFYFRYAYQNGFTCQDWSTAVPRVIAAKNLNIPALWEESELILLLRSIDRGNPLGKRNYAMILLVAQLGLRASDVSNLRLNNLNWEQGALEFVQHKNRKYTTEPLLENVGWAMIDYLQYGRPKVEESFVFLTSNAPYTQITPAAITAVLSRQMRRCGIKKQTGTVSGLHSLRHAMARRLLENGTPLETVADIMGHTSLSSTSPYLKVDIDGLRECSLSIAEVPNE